MGHLQHPQAGVIIADIGVSPFVEGDPVAVRVCHTPKGVHADQLPLAKWELVGVDTLRGVAYPDRNGIALDERGNAYISYYDSGLGVLKVAHRLGRQWVVEVVDQNSAGFASSIQIGQGDIWVSYANETGEQLKVARRPLQDPETPAKPGEAR